MAHESTTPELVERWRQAAKAASRGDLDVAMGIFAADAVWEVLPLGISHRGPPAIRSFLEDWLGSYENGGPLAVAVTAIGFAVTLAWIVWRFGPTLLRLAGFCSLWVAWACGSQGGYAYSASFLMIGVFAWGAGTVWYARRRGRWPSRFSTRLFARLSVRQRHNR